MQPDNPLIRTEIQQFCEVQVLGIERVVATWPRLHDTPILRLNRESRRILEPIRKPAGVLPNDDAEDPADHIEQTPNGQDSWHSDQQNREGHEQRDANRSGERRQRVNERPFS